MSSNEQMIRNIVEAALLAAGEPVSLDRLRALFEEGEGTPGATLPEVGRSELRTALDALADDYAERGLELKEVASGWRVQVRGDMAPWVSRLWDSRAPRYSRALLETLVLIAYQQPVTRSDIEQVRGVSVSSNIIKTLLERDWIRIVGHRDVPGRPALYGTTRAFLDYFNLRSLDQLPPLAEIRDLGRLNQELGFEDGPGSSADTDGDDEGSAEVVPLTAVLGQFETPDDSGAEPVPDGAGTFDVPPEDMALVAAADAGEYTAAELDPAAEAGGPDAASAAPSLEEPEADIPAELDEDDGEVPDGASDDDVDATMEPGPDTVAPDRATPSPAPEDGTDTDPDADPGTPS